MKRLKNVLLALLFLAIIVGGIFAWRDIMTTKRSETKRLNGVSRVMMHGPSRYTILVEKSDGSIAQHYFGNSWCKRIVPKIYHDVPNDQPMWIEYRTAKNDRKTCSELLAIHVRSANNINGAGWNHGKFGRGHTTVLQ